jgi:hypothetical protein
MSWNAFRNGTSLEQIGSEGGIVLRDEEHSAGARISLEHDGRSAPYAITCGIYGWMVHTRFIGVESEALKEFESMKLELSRIMSMLLLVADQEMNAKLSVVSKSLAEFVKKFA